MPKILWISPYSLHDSSCGHLIHCKEMLERLSQKGYKVWVCSSFVFEHPENAQIFEDLEYKLKNDPHNTFVLEHNQINYIYTRCASFHENEFTLAEAQLFYETYLNVLDQFKPDLVIGNSVSPLSINCYAEAKRRGLGTVFVLLNNHYLNFRFPNTDLILTDSEATTKLYAYHEHINIIPTGIILYNRLRFMVQNYNRQYVTLINPSGKKGLSIFAKLVLSCKEQFPNLRFLVINTINSNFSEKVMALHDKDNPHSHPLDVANFTNVDMTDMPRDLRPVYQITKVLLAPTLEYESWCHYVTEAVLNGITVLSSNLGGLPESLAQGGITIEPPLHCIQDVMSLPTTEEIQPWIEALKRLLTEPWQDKLKQAQATLDSEIAINKVIEHLQPLCQRRASDHINYFNSY